MWEITGLAHTDTLKVGDKFTIKYVSEADPDGYFKWIENTTFIVKKVLTNSIECGISVIL